MEKPLDEKALTKAFSAYASNGSPYAALEAGIRTYLEATQSGESEAVQIANAVLNWFVQKEMLDAGAEYVAVDIVEVLESLVDPDFSDPSLAALQADNERLREALNPKVVKPLLEYFEALMRTNPDEHPIYPKNKVRPFSNGDIAFFVHGLRYARAALAGQEKPE